MNLPLLVSPNPFQLSHEQLHGLQNLFGSPTHGSTLQSTLSFCPVKRPGQIKRRFLKT
jgi:hypothetical protein